MNSIVIYGPSGCGKTTNAQLFSDFFQLAYVRDDGQRDTFVPALDHLILCESIPQKLPYGVSVLTYEMAMKLVKEDDIKEAA